MKKIKENKLKMLIKKIDAWLERIIEFPGFPQS